MKKALTLIAVAGLLVVGMTSVGFAQAASGPFADVPADHWAYQAVDTLQKAGIVIGYPDGTYSGKRAMTRYEFAVALARLMPLIQQKPATETNNATKDDLAALRSDLESKLQANTDAIDAIRKLVDEFQPELQKLGQDVAAVKDRLDSLEARVAAVEEEQRRVKFNGALNLIVRGDAVTKSTGFIDQNGVAITPVNPTTVATDGKHLLQQTDVYQDFVLGIRGKLSDTATANVKLDFGNYLSAVGNTAGGSTLDASGLAVTPGNLNAGNQQTTVWEANVQMPVDLGPLGGADLVAGRFGNQWTQWTLKQIDADVYTSLYQTDSGNVINDGAKVDLKVGPAKVSAFASKFDATPFSQLFGGNGPGTGGVPAGLMSNNHSANIDDGVGARATFGSANCGILGVTIENFGVGSVFNPVTGSLTGVPAVDPNLGRPYGVLSVYGLDYNGEIPYFKTSGLSLDASFTATAEGSSTRAFNDSGKGWRYDETEAQLGYNLGALKLKGGYQFIGPQFSSPGSWGRVGSWINPTNVEGGVGSAKYTVSPKLNVNADVEGYKGAYNDNTSSLSNGDKLTAYQVGVGYGLTKTYDVNVSYQQALYDIDTRSILGHKKPRQDFLTFGVGHTFNQNASFKLLYQVDTFKGDTVAGPDNGGDVAVGQFSLKF